MGCSCVSLCMDSRLSSFGNSCSNHFFKHSAFCIDGTLVGASVGNCFRLCFWLACSIRESVNINRAAHISQSDPGRFDERPCLVQQMEGGNSDSCRSNRHLALSSFRMVPANAHHNVAIRSRVNIDRCPTDTEMDHQVHYNEKPS